MSWALVPMTSRRRRGSGPAVYRVDETNALQLQPVTVASFTEDVALVTSGLRDGDKVVTLGVQKLETGLTVRTLNP